MRDATAPKITFMLQRLRKKTGVPEGIRTPDLRFRKPLLYPAELPGRARHYSRKARNHSRALGWALMSLVWMGPSLAQTCPKPEQNVGPVIKIHSRLELELRDGRLIKPIHLMGFEPSARGAARMAQAQAALQDWTRGQALALPQRLPLPDRWGRLLTPAFLASGEDIGLKLVAQGLMRVGPNQTDPCLAPLLAAEIQARNAKLGLWADSYYAVLLTQSPADFTAKAREHAGEFVIVEGQVQRVGQTPARFYLDLGSAKGSNLSVTFSRQYAKAFASNGVAAEGLMGKTIRVRGQLEYRTRSQIEIYTPAAVEVMDVKL